MNAQLVEKKMKIKNTYYSVKKSLKETKNSKNIQSMRKYLKEMLMNKFILQRFFKKTWT